VAEAEAADGSLVVFSDNASDPETYPVVADLKLIDFGHEDEPRLIEEKVLGSKNFWVDEAGTRVAYVRSGVDRDLEEAEHDGAFSVSIR